MWEVGVGCVGVLVGVALCGHFVNNQFVVRFGLPASNL